MFFETQNESGAGSFACLICFRPSEIPINLDFVARNSFGTLGLMKRVLMPSVGSREKPASDTRDYPG